MAVRKGNNIKPWLVFFLFGVRETAENSIQVFKDIVALRRRLDKEVLPCFSTRRQQNAQSLMQALYQTPVIRINTVTELLGIPHNTATALVRDFVAHGVLYEMTEKKRNRVYWFRDYLSIFVGDGN